MIEIEITEMIETLCVCLSAYEDYFGRKLAMLCDLILINLSSESCAILDLDF